MISENDPLVGRFAAADASFGDEVRTRAVVHVDFQVNDDALAAQFIFQRQAALPGVGSFGPIHFFEQRLGVMPGKRNAHDFGKRYRVFRANSFCAGNGSVAGREWIAGLDEIVGDGAALNVTLGAPGAVGVDRAFFVSIFGGIGINQDGGGAETFGGEGFESAVRVRIGVADQNDFAADVDAVLAEVIVVLGIAAVGVDDGSSDFSRRGISEVGAVGFGILGVGIEVVGIFAQGGDVAFGLDHFERNLAWGGMQDVVLVDADVFETLLAPSLGDPLGELVIARRAGGVRLGGEVAMKC